MAGQSKNIKTGSSSSSSSSSNSYERTGGVVPPGVSIGLGKYAPQVNLVQITNEPPTAAFKRDFGDKSFSLYNDDNENAGGRIVDPAPITYNGMTNHVNYDDGSKGVAEFKELPLPEGWIEAIDPNTNGPYYVNRLTGQSQWDQPTQPAVSLVARGGSLPSGSLSAGSLPSLSTGSLPSGSVPVVAGGGSLSTGSLPSGSVPAVAGGGSVPEVAGGGSLPSGSLSEGWMEVIDPNTNKPYYVNKFSGQTQWEKPTQPAVPIPPAYAPPTGAPPTRSNQTGYEESKESKSKYEIQKRDRSMQPGKNLFNLMKIDANLLDPYNGRPVDPNYALPFTLDPKFNNSENFSIPITLDPKLKNSSDFSIPITLDPKLKNSSDFSIPITLDPKMKNNSDYSLPFTLDPKLKPVPQKEVPSEKADWDLSATDVIRAFGVAADIAGKPRTPQEIEEQRKAIAEKKAAEAEAARIKEAEEKEKEALMKEAVEKEKEAARIKEAEEKEAALIKEIKDREAALIKEAEEKEAALKEAEEKEAALKEAKDKEAALKETKEKVELEKVAAKFAALQKKDDFEEEVDSRRERERRPSKMLLHRRASARIVDDDEDEHDHHYDLVIQEEEHEIIDIEPHHEEFDKLEQAYNADAEVIDEDNSEFISTIEDGMEGAEEDDEEDLSPVDRFFEPEDTPDSKLNCNIPFIGSYLNVFDFSNNNTSSKTNKF